MSIKGSWSYSVSVVLWSTERIMPLLIFRRFYLCMSVLYFSVLNTVLKNNTFLNNYFKANHYLLLVKVNRYRVCSLIQEKVTEDHRDLE